MRKLYVKLAAVNIRNNRQLYLPYLLAGVFSAAMFYLVMSIQDNPGLEQMRGGANVAVTLLLGVIIVGLFAAIFLFYTNSFIMKRRKRELSVYNILGRRNISPGCFSWKCCLRRRLRSAEDCCSALHSAS